MHILVVILMLLLWLVCAESAQPTSPLLPLPDSKVTSLPPLVPTVITAGGQRRLLNDTDVSVRYEPSRKTLIVNRPGWWVINYPLTRIQGLEGKPAQEIAPLLFDRPLHKLGNWYVKTPGEPPSEPPPPGGPAPIDLTPQPTIVVNTQHDRANDRNPGNLAAPLKTIGAAVKRARPSDIIHVHPGIYRESLSIEQSGTVEQPIRLEGVRDRHGRLPVISGNDLFPAKAWTPVRGLPGVYRTTLFTQQLGPVSVNGQTLIERSIPAELKPGEFCLNRASSEFLNLRLDGHVDPKEGERQGSKVWRRVQTDPDGFFDLQKGFGMEAKGAVFWASTYVWVEPRRRGPGWNPDAAEVISGRLPVSGEFRGARMTGAPLSAQVNKYRVWVNGQLLPSVVYSTEQDLQLWLPHPSRNYGISDNWERFPLREGWNHLVFQFDTTSRPEKTRFKFGLPQKLEHIVTSAAAPPTRDQPTASPPRPYIAAYLVLGPFPARPDLGVYVRLPGDVDPNTVPMDLAARTSPLVNIQANFVQVRAFEIRHGAQRQQQAYVDLKGEGIVLEGNLIRDGEVRGISLTADRDQSAAPIIVRNNWVVNPGNVGIGGGGTSAYLTPHNQNDRAPGRSPILIEHNTVINSNWAGFSPGWEAGGVKLFRLTGAVIRYNTIIGGSGPGIWLDTENYGNRVEGNLFRSVFAYGVGIEASPGPNLVANNLSIGLRPGLEWFRAGILAWDSDRTWAVNNTIDGGWNPIVWGRTVGTIGVNLGKGGQSSIRWGPLLNSQQAYINNLVVGSQTALRPREQDIASANFSEKGTGAESFEVTFRAPQTQDYRLTLQSPLNHLGSQNEFTTFVSHDFNGLLRFQEDGRSVGAFRHEPVPTPGTHTQVELELQDGTFQRLYEVQR